MKETVHSGLPVTKGVKVGLNIWSWWQRGLEVEDLKEQLRAKDNLIKKFEMFIDICNERVMAQRERLAEDGPVATAPVDR